MKNKAILYSVNGMEFIRLQFTPRKPYTSKYLNKLAGFTLSDHAPEYLHRYGCLRVCKDCEGSWRKD